MKFCPTHWSELRQAIEARGLGALVAKSGGELAECMQAGGFEPLMVAHNAIVSNIALAVPDAVFNNDEGCPLCVVINGCPCTEGEACPFRKWIGFAADDMLAIAKEKGLVSSS